MNKKTIVAICVIAVAGSMFATPRGGHHHHGGRHVAPRHHHVHRPKHSTWGRGGRNFWPGFVGGLVGATVARTVIEPATTIVTAPAVVTPVVTATPVVTTAPVVVETPVVTATQQVWVEGRYVDTVQPNGTVVRVWQPGHYETVTTAVR